MNSSSVIRLPSSLLLVGCGKMGSALLARWHETHPAGVGQFFVIDPMPAHGATCLRDLHALPADIKPDVIVFAVKPQSLAEILPAYAERFGTSPLYISIAAGKTLSFFEEHLGTHAHIVRAMPNTPAMIGQGMTALAAKNTLAESARHIATELMGAAGQVAWVEENQMDAVTAISGSGPAYVFLFLDALTQAGVKAGLDEKTAKQLATQTVIGSAALAAASHESFEQLRKNVTSPNGTTQAALDVLMKGDALVKLVEEAVTAAARRSKELAQ
ncbi:MAG: pyrroline-5-carboxylate reductase [Alphaproteobacteria bacterium]|nr:pyrroline-5-carboxylate reductase [Alphaproteobacteria bacterium]